MAQRTEFNEQTAAYRSKWGVEQYAFKRNYTQPKIYILAKCKVPEVVEVDVKIFQFSLNREDFGIYIVFLDFVAVFIFAYFIWYLDNS